MAASPTARGYLFATPLVLVLAATAERVLLTSRVAAQQGIK